LSKAEANMRRHAGCDKRRSTADVAHRHLRATQAQVTKWEGVRDASPQSTGEVAHRLPAEIEALEALAQQHQLPSKPDMTWRCKASRQHWRGAIADRKIVQLPTRCSWF
jgi:hypothetical protein